MKDNLGQECVKKGLLSYQGKIETIALDFPENNSFSLLTLLFHVSVPKIWLSHPNKNYIFWNEKQYGYLLEKFYNVIFKTVDLVATWIIGYFRLKSSDFPDKAPILWGVAMVTK